MSLLESVKKTWKYAKKHGGNLNKEELWERLIGGEIYKKKEVDELLKNNSEIEKEIISNNKNEIVELKIKKARELVKLIELNFEDILFLGITGSVAAGYPKKDDDIDLLIIVRKDKLWINRLKLRWWIAINKIPHRRFGEKEKADEFCFNLWLDESMMSLPKKRHNLKNAVDLILMKPLINKNMTYEKFIKVNDWTKKYVATGYSLKPSVPQLRDTSLDPASWRASREALLDKVINWLVFWPQYWYMRNKIIKERVGLHEAYFHH